MMRMCSMCWVLLAALFFTWSGAFAEVRNPKGVAVIVGNVDYEHRDVPDVSFAHRDADAFRRYVVDVLGFDIENIIDLRDATRRRIFDALGSVHNPRGGLWSYLDPEGGSDVVVFYSGHGVPGMKDKRGYLLPVDGSPHEAEKDGYPLDLLYRNLGNLEEARSVVVYLDASFSGSSHGGNLTRSATPVNVRAELPTELSKKVTVLTAATGTQLASWDERARHGLFTHHLLDALYGRGDIDKDGKVTAKEAKRYLDKRMTRAARRQHRRIQQASLSGAGDVVLSTAVSGNFPERASLGGRPKADRKKTEKVATPWKPSAEEKEVVLDIERRVVVQRGLASLGFDPGPIDGLFVSKTRAAIQAWQKAKGYGVTGRLTKSQADALVAAGVEAQREEDESELLALEAKEKKETERKAREAAERARAAIEEQKREEAERKRALLRPGNIFRDCPECPEMVVVPAGSFLMGSPSSERDRYKREGPRHRVKIPKTFAVGRYEVTKHEFGAFVRATERDMVGGCGFYSFWKKEFDGDIDDKRSWRRPGYKQTGRDPVVCVNWEDAKAYVRWLFQKTGKRYRLLSESEWEYAARGGTRTSYYWGEDARKQCAHANGADRTFKKHYRNFNWPIASCRDGFVYTAPAGSFSANGFGLHDMLGNVWEWVADCWNRNYAGAPSDGSAWTRGDCSRRVKRGGSWNTAGKGSLRSAIRARSGSVLHMYDAGLRVARSLAEISEGALRRKAEREYKEREARERAEAEGKVRKKAERERLALEAKDKEETERKTQWRFHCV